MPEALPGILLVIWAVVSGAAVSRLRRGTPGLKAQARRRAMTIWAAAESIGLAVVGASLFADLAVGGTTRAWALVLFGAASGLVAGLVLAWMLWLSVVGSSPRKSSG
jgi:hypothetical protein